MRGDRCCPACGQVIPRPALVVARPWNAALLDAIDRELGDLDCDAWRFFQTVVALPPATRRTVSRLAPHLAVRTPTLNSRFFRADLPSPKAYVARIGLVHAASLWRDPKLSLGYIAAVLDYNSPQGFSRHVRDLTGLSPGRARVALDEAEMRTQFVDVMVRPYLAALRSTPLLTADVPAARREHAMREMAS